MTSIRLLNAAEPPPPDAPGAEPDGAPVRTLEPRLPAADASAFAPGGDEGPFEIGVLAQRVDDAAETAAKAWPDISPPARAGASRGSIEDPALAAQRREIANLQTLRERQTAALERARDQIIGLDDSVKLLSARLTQQEKETAAAQQAQARAEADNAALRTDRAQADANFVELLRQTSELRAAFEQQEKDMAAMRARVATLKQELTARAADDIGLSSAIEEAKARFYKDFDKRTAQFEAETEKLARAIGAREERIRSLEDENAQLAARCEGLARNAAEFEAGKKQADEKLEAQAAMVGFLDATLQAEREATGRKIATLTAELQQERLARAGEAREAAAVRREIMRLLPRLTGEPERAATPGEAEPVAGSAANDSSVGQKQQAASS